MVQAVGPVSENFFDFCQATYMYVAVTLTGYVHTVFGTYHDGDKKYNN
jgi:hypothetical protein